MSRISSWWAWLSNPDNRAVLALIGGAAVSVIGAGWALFKHFSKPLSEIKPTVTGVQIGGSVTAGRDVVIQNIQTTPEQFDALLQRRLKEVMGQLPQADPAQRGLLEKELAAIKAKHDNLIEAYEEQKAKLAEAYKALDQFKQEFSAGQIEQAQKALARGKTKAAENLYEQVLAKSTAEAKKRTKEAAEAACQLGVLAESRIHYGKAWEYYQKAVQLQPGNPVYLNVGGNLSRTLGHYQESEKLLKRALELREKSLKPDDPALATSLNNLALLYAAQGKYGEAEPLHKRALATLEKALGPEHPQVATNLSNLASLYADQGKHQEAEPLYERALAIDEKALGPEHPHVAICLNNLAELYREQGKYKEAEPLYQRALAIDEKALGPDHPDVATDLEEYAALLKKMGRAKEAALLEARATGDSGQAGPEKSPVEEIIN
jgi:tetratricopeptide (TPR) repeat protein